MQAPTLDGQPSTSDEAHSLMSSQSVPFHANPGAQTDGVAPSQDSPLQPEVAYGTNTKFSLRFGAPRWRSRSLMGYKKNTIEKGKQREGREACRLWKNGEKSLRRVSRHKGGREGDAIETNGPFGTGRSDQNAVGARDANFCRASKRQAGFSFARRMRMRTERRLHTTSSRGMDKHAARDERKLANDGGIM